MLAELLRACQDVGAAVEQGSGTAADALQTCLQQMEGTELNEKEMRQASEVLLRLRAAVQANADYFRIRGHLSRTLARFAARAAAPEQGRVDFTL